MRFSFPAICTLLLTTTALQAQAETAQNITPAKLEKFYTDAAQVFTAGYNDYVTWIGNAMTDDVQSRSKSIIHMPDQAPAEFQDVADKQKILSMAQQTFDSMKNGSLTNTITKTEIAPDGRSARVEEMSSARNVIIPGPGGQILRADMKGICHDTVVLAPQGHLQIKTTDCTVDVVVQTQQDL